jgi:ABC-type multidrug transport system ATPase subunit
MIDHGRLIVYDTIENVTAKFAGDGGAAEVGFSRDLDEETVSGVLRLEGLEKAQKTDPRHLSIRFRGGLQTQERLFSQLAGMNIGTISFRETSTGLEDAYLKLITETV